MLGELTKGPRANLKQKKKINGTQLNHLSLNIRVLIGRNVEQSFKSESSMILEYICPTYTNLLKSIRCNYKN